MRRIIPIVIALTIGVTCFSISPLNSATGSPRTHPSNSLPSPWTVTVPTVASTLPPPTTTTPPPPSPVTAPPSPTSTTTPTTSPVVPSAPEAGSDGVAEWTRVAVCEEGGWGQHTYGQGYVGDLGISTPNWYAYGGGSDLSPAAQVAVAERIDGGYVPDGDGCTGW